MQNTNKIRRRRRPSEIACLAMMVPLGMAMIWLAIDPKGALGWVCGMLLLTNLVLIWAMYQGIVVRQGKSRWLLTPAIICAGLYLILAVHYLTNGA